ncbi:MULTISPECIES: ParA family protein [Pseudomonas]|uniref:Chromosome (Plasmid) partitioning protein ParA n=1 Tax=Pseudomonas syringae pv. actinidiae TaxID=103796 RepID=A0A2P0QFS0_PSESF|nr:MULTISPECIES: ParA family protein [Pseudomonas]APQ06987.1 partition protein A [Pseudomonas syringae pv. actinidiae]ARO44969.1 Chromosome (plasmid) partitioning protein ParA [Pseudomonas syringae pv. actinidiae]ARO45074.1 Chromosome (plasmid) partitioning protein ParA [Pseudomonas syringae pv. actinidiae]ARO45165.1 Chromosome (plasmid) partitioning protein ParA [Pseudomonas syringae pv. actinidiae]ARO45207.1 Chromosome (plasmid) partitioning protein ParA [Pseudomonas syringae pv. actinidiae]
MKVVTVTNQKGGVGKTAIAIHLSMLAGEQEKRVLMLDLDEGDLSSFFPATDDDDDTQYLMSSHLFDDSQAVGQPRQVGPNMWLVEADVPLLDVDEMHLDVVHRLKHALSAYSESFDICIIDTPPNLQRRMVGALIAADCVVSPFNISPFTLARMPKLMRTIENVQDEYNPNLTFLGFLPNMVNSRSPDEIDALPGLREGYGDLIFDEQIIYRPCINKSLGNGLPVWKRANGSSQRIAGREMKSACNSILSKIWAN